MKIAAGRLICGTSATTAVATNSSQLILLLGLLVLRMHSRACWTTASCFSGIGTPHVPPPAARRLLRSTASAVSQRIRVPIPSSTTKATANAFLRDPQRPTQRPTPTPLSWHLGSSTTSTSTSEYSTTSTSTSTTTANMTSSSLSSSSATTAVAATARTTALRTSDILACARHLQQGGLVAFPTETVYGLGCSAVHVAAVEAVFRAKERPATDPLIVHVLEPSDAYPLWKATSALAARLDEVESSDNGNDNNNNDNDNNNHLEARILQTLTTAFWPGPLTLVAEAVVRNNNDNNNSNDDNDGRVVPDAVMAGTGFVACRSPRHARARQLLEATQLPLAAPSANKFGHVSPTTAQHVWDDLHNEPNVWILEDEEQQVNDDDADADDAASGAVLPSCDRVGVESTVAKVERRLDDNNNGDDTWHYVVTVLRHGAVAASELQDCLREAGLDSCVTVTTKHPQRRTRTTAATTTTDPNNNNNDDDVAHVAPGQTIRHYSPHVPSYLVSRHCLQQEQQPQCAQENDIDILRQAVVLDYSGRLASWKAQVLAYRDLSVTGNSMEAAQHLFDALRWAEQVEGAERILFPQVVVVDVDDNDCGGDDDALTLAVHDRLTRAASGVLIDRLSDAR